MSLRTRPLSGMVALSIAMAVSGCGGESAGGGGGGIAPPPSAVTQIFTSDKYPGITCESTFVAMRDGVKLATFIYRPAGIVGPLPVLLARNPYGRAAGEGCFIGYGFVGGYEKVARGYAVVSQAVRGSFTSEGTFDLMTQEANDGYDAIEWAGTQPWSNGKVGMFSSSYLGLTQWQAAINAPPHLVAIAPGITGSDYHDNWAYVNGVFSEWLNISWPANLFEVDQIIRAGQASGTPQAQIDASVDTWNASLDATTSWAATLPLTSISQFKAHQPFFYEWLAHPTYDDYWKKMDVEANYQNVKVPALLTGASYDLFNVGSVRNFQGMRAKAGTPAARSGTKIVWGAYGHGGDSGTPTFGSDVNPDAEIEMRFFDFHLKGIQNGADTEPNARIYVMVPPDNGDKGTGFWVSGDDFPLPGTQSVKYFMMSNGNAATRAGDGVLTTDVAQLGSADRDTFIYDPRNPVPTVGGNMCCDGVRVLAGAREQESVESRRDVLVYTSAPLEADLPIIGMVKSSFWAMTTAKDTDFTVKLIDVRPDEKSHNVIDRIVRASLRAGSKLPPSLIQPNTPYQFTLEMGNTAIVIPKGHRLRIQVSSSNFPFYARNLNTGDDSNSTSAVVDATQTLLHGTMQPSYIELPVAPVARP